ncbi:MAG TPA: AAA family ATPase, partial [Acidimicrobiia bacterium]
MRIFLSYRRSDTAGHAGRLFDALTARLGVGTVFMDVDTIAPGVDFTTAVRDAISGCDLVLALIGQQWLTAQDPQGRERLHLEDDYLRLEIEAALQRDIPTVPVLVQDARMPHPDELPPSIAAFAHRNAIALTDHRWHQELDAFIAWIDDTVAPAANRGDEQAQRSDPGRERGERADAAQAAAPARRQERKVVTVLLATLVGVDAADDSLDVEDAIDTLTPIRKRVSATVESFGGSPERFAGDSMMGVFGAPVAHEDDPERAVRAALAIRDAVADLGGRVQVRIGINTGEALVTENAGRGNDDALVAGAVVNGAVELQAGAPLDGVLVSDATFRAAQGQIVFETSPAVSAPARSEPVACWRAVEPRSLVPIATRETLPFVGRERERRRLIDAFEDCRADRQVQLVTIVGVPGIGKSRLVAELGAYVDADAELTTWRHGHVLPYGSGVAFFALSEIVQQECGILGSDDAHTGAEKLDDAVAALGIDGSDALWVRNQVAPLVGLGATEDGSRQSEAFGGWRLLLEAMAADTPTVLVFDDLHWADDALLDFVDGLVDRVSGVPLLVVATARPELLEQRAGWGGGKANATTISLAPLANEHINALIDTLADRSRIPPDIEAALVERAGGNPLYAQEYVRAIVERGANGELPDTVQGIITARIDGLSPDEKDLLHDAAVIGPTFWLGSLCSLGDRVRSDADGLLSRLERKQLVQRARRSTIADDTEFSFAHALIRDVCYQQLTRRARAERHERAAAWLEHTATDRGDSAELLAHHFDRAIELLQALGDDTTAIAPAARIALADAARHAAARHDHRAVIRYTDTALGLKPDAALRAELLVLQADARFLADVPDEALMLAARDAAIATGRSEDAVKVSHLLAGWAENYAAAAAQVASYQETAMRLAAELPPGPVATRPVAFAAYRMLI